MDFGKLLGVSTATISAWEQERRQPTPKRMAHALLRLIAVRPEWCVEALGPPRARKRSPDKRRRVARGVLAKCRELAQGAAGRVPLDRLRGALANLDAEALDGELMRLEKTGRVTLSAPLFPGQLSEEERAALLNHPDGRSVLFVDLGKS
jgi:hypothetical protein